MIVTNLQCEYMKSPMSLDESTPRFGWNIESEEKGKMQTAYQILISDDINKLNNNNGNVWDSGKVLSNETNNIEYNGFELKSCQKYYWKVRVWDENECASDFSNLSSFEMAFIDKSMWNGKWIYINISNDLKSKYASFKTGLPSPYFRKEFKIEKKIRSARMYATALGLYEAYINGQKVSNDELTPGWTDYNKRIMYQTYDVTGILKFGNNAVASVLGDGWYTGNVAITGRKQYGDYPLKFSCILNINYDDGTFESIISDSTWKCSTGAVCYSDLLMGEGYDARCEPDGWNTAEFDDESWLTAEEDEIDKDKLYSQIGNSVKVVRELKPISMARYNENTYIFDMGQNMVGRVYMKVRGKKGTEVKLRFGEMLNKDGSLYTANLRTADQTDIYVLKGKGEEHFEPKFTFHGFRYVEVTGYPGKIELNSLIGKVLSTNLPETGKIECSNKMVNKLISNIYWSQIGNFLSVPTDCPQRDERMGWTGDGEIFARTACFNMNCHSFYEKWQRDITDAQMNCGAYTDVAPYVINKDGTGLVGYGNAAWGDAGVIIPYTLYKCYGDKRVIERNFESMKRWIEYLKENSSNLIRPDFGYGDWLSIDADTPKDVMSTAYFAYSTLLVSKMAEAICKRTEADGYKKLFNDIKDAFNKAFVHEDGRIKGDTQTCYVLALKFDLLDEDKKKTAAKYLVEDIKKRNWHLSTGFVGVSYLLPILSDYGYDEAAYTLLLNDTYPSWGYSIKNGATTIWERWNSYTRENGFGDVGMNSFNHYSIGSVGEWLYRYVGGIDTDSKQTGYKRIIIKPSIDPLKRITYFNARYNSISGEIVSKWSIEENNFKLDVTIPANTDAVVFIPIGEKPIIKENGINIEDCSDINILKKNTNCVALEIGSGRYQFTSFNIN